MSRVLVVGATGLLGRYVARAVEAHGHEVHSAARGIEVSSTSHRLDLADLTETERVLRKVQPDVLVQMTGGTASDPVLLAEVNIVPTVNLIRAAVLLDRSPAIFITGSAAEYGDPGDQKASESSPLRPLSSYGWMKVAETSTALALARHHNLNLTVVRPFNPVVPELPSSTALGNFRSQLLKSHGESRRIVCGRVDVVRDFVTGDFIGDAVARLVVRPPGGIVNICSGIGIRLEEVMLAAAQLAGVEIHLEEDPDLAALPAPSVIVGDPDRLQSLTGARADSNPELLAAALLNRLHP